VLLAPVTPFLRKTADNPAGLPVAVQQKLLSDIATDFPKWVADGTRPFFRAETSPETMAWMADMMLGTPIAVAHACAQAFMGEDFRPDLKSLRLPTLVVHGDRDASAPLALTGKRSAEMIAGARLEVIPGAPHGLFVTDAERVNNLISEFARA
jgi:pimeloyl-ACP methyl ester carboxylesterase